MFQPAGTPLAAQVPHDVVEVRHPGRRQTQRQPVVRAEHVHRDRAAERVPHAPDPVPPHLRPRAEIVDPPHDVVGHLPDHRPPHLVAPVDPELQPMPPHPCAVLLVPLLLPHRVRDQADQPRLRVNLPRVLIVERRALAPPVPTRKDQRGDREGHPLRQVEVRRHRRPRLGVVDHLFEDEIVPLHPADRPGVQRPVRLGKVEDPAERRPQRRAVRLPRLAGARKPLPDPRLRQPAQLLLEIGHVPGLDLRVRLLQRGHGIRSFAQNPWIIPPRIVYLSPPDQRLRQESSRFTTEEAERWSCTSPGSATSTSTTGSRPCTSTWARRRMRSRPPRAGASARSPSPPPVWSSRPARAEAPAPSPTTTRTWRWAIRRAGRPASSTSSPCTGPSTPSAPSTTSGTASSASAWSTRTAEGPSPSPPASWTATRRSSTTCSAGPSPSGPRTDWINPSPAGTPAAPWPVSTCRATAGSSRR